MDKKEKTNSYNKNGYYKVNAQEYDLDVTGVADSGPGFIYVRHLRDDCIYTPDHQGDIDLPVYPGVTSYMLQTSMNAKNPFSIHVIHF